MANVSLPTPVALAGGALCLIGGYLLGALTGPDTPARATATVQSYDASSQRLCLTGDGVADESAAQDGVLCGTWRRSTDAGSPRQGQEFRFVTVGGGSASSDGHDPTTVIYGDVVG